MHLIDELVEFAIKTARDLQLTHHIDRSTASEATYLKIHRDRHWFGLRIAAHPPAYVCSADYEQLLVPTCGTATRAFERFAQRRVSKFVSAAGCVVAGPVEIEAAIRQLFINRRTATRRNLPSAYEICATRHRLNLRAVWSYEIEQGLIEP